MSLLLIVSALPSVWHSLPSAVEGRTERERERKRERGREREREREKERERERVQAQKFTWLKGITNRKYMLRYKNYKHIVLHVPC